MNPKILVASPTFSGMEYCEKKFFERLKELTYSNYGILIVDNSLGENYYKKLKDVYKIDVIHDNTNEKKSIFRLISSRNKILNYGIEKDYDYILMLDSDVIPPRNVIEELLRWNKDIISGIYLNYFNISKQTKLLPVAKKIFTEKEFEELKRLYPKFSSAERKSVLRHLSEEEMKSNKLIEVQIPAGGCMLISKNVFEKIRYGRFSTSGGADDDVYFAKKAKENGFKIYCYPKMFCKHIIKEKYKIDEKGTLVHSSFTDIIKK